MGNSGVEKQGSGVVASELTCPPPPPEDDGAPRSPTTRALLPSANADSSQISKMPASQRQKGRTHPFKSAKRPLCAMHGPSSGGTRMHGDPRSAEQAALQGRQT